MLDNLELNAPLTTKTFNLHSQFTFLRLFWNIKPVSRIQLLFDCKIPFSSMYNQDKVLSIIVGNLRISRNNEIPTRYYFTAICKNVDSALFKEGARHHNKVHSYYMPIVQGKVSEKDNKQ
jgi:hypothetical protein